MGRYSFSNPSFEFMLSVAMGKVPGMSHINKFGHNPAIETGTDPEDVWHGGGVYPFYPLTAQTLEVLSDSVEDDADKEPAGTGAYTIIIYGLDGNFNEVNETVTLNGAGIVALTEHTYRRVYRAIILTAGSSGSNVGNIVVRIASAGASAAYIATADGQTQQAIYTIPEGKTGFFIKGYVGVSAGGVGASNESAIFQWKLRANNGVAGAWQVNGQIECTTRGSSWWQYKYGIPAGPISEMSDIKIECTEVSTTLGVVGAFDLLLVENRLL